MAVWVAERKSRSPYGRPWLVEALAAFDERQRRRQAVFEYSHNTACIFRLDISRARRLLMLRDGTRVDAIAAGEAEAGDGEACLAERPRAHLRILWMTTTGLAFRD